MRLLNNGELVEFIYTDLKGIRATWRGEVRSTNYDKGYFRLNIKGQTYPLTFRFENVEGDIRRLVGA